MVDDAKQRAQDTYDAAAEYFDEPALSFWDRFGRATVERLGLHQGAVVLDACAGSGASAIPAAELVGPTGRVIAVDLAPKMLALARSKADLLGLHQLETKRADVEELEYPPGMFDAVVTVFGLFFLPNMVGAASSLWRLVGPGGQLAVTTWGPRLWEPANTEFWDAVDHVRPDLTRSYNPWEALTDPASVTELLRAAGVERCQVEPVTASHPLRAPEDFWTIVQGSGYRATHDALSVEEREEVRNRCLDAIRRRHIDSIETNVIYANAVRPSASRS